MEIKDLVIDNRSEGIFRVHHSTMTSPEIFQLERERIFDKSWLYIGHESEVENPGDYRRREVAGRPLILVRGNDGRVRVFLNSCTHRGAKVCRQDEGNAGVFQCFYHAWTFNNKGELVGIPDEAGYSKGLKRTELALKSPPRLDSYRGFYFVSFNADVADLVTYLADATEYIDLIVDQSEAGMRVVAGSQKYTIRANWKLLADNSLDSYHGLPLHSTFFNYLASVGGRPLDYVTSKQETGRSVEMNSGVLRPQGYGRALGNGHGVAESPVLGMPRPIAHWHPVFGEDAKEEIAAIRTRLVERYGEERTYRMADTFRLFLIYPNLVLHDIPAITIRSFEPVAPDRMEVTVWALAPKEETAPQLERRLNNFLSFIGPGGFAHPDDAEALESCQDGFRAKELEWSDFSRGMHRSAQSTDELQTRAFWRQWHAQMLGLAESDQSEGQMDEGSEALAAGGS